MASTRISSIMRDKLKRLAAGALQDVFIFRGIQAGKTPENVLTGIQSAKPRASTVKVAGLSAFSWRGNVDGGVVKRGPVKIDESGEHSMQFDVERLNDFTQDPGTFYGIDFIHGIVDTDAITEWPGGFAQDTVVTGGSTGMGPMTVYGFREQVVTGLPSVANQTWVFSFYVSKLVASATSDTIDVRIELSDGSETQTTINTIAENVPWARVEAKITFSGAPATNDIRVGIGPNNSHVGWSVTACQLEQAASPTAFEWTAPGAGGTTNKLSGSLWPHRGADWAWNGTAGTLEATPSKAGPWDSIIGPPPGAIWFGLSESRAAFPDGLLEMRSDDKHGAVAQELNITGVGGNAFQAAFSGTAVQNRTYIFSFWAREVSGGLSNVKLEIQQRDSGSTPLGAAVAETYAISRHWRRLWVSIVASDASVDNLMCRAFAGSGETGKVEVFGGQCEEYSTSTVDEIIPGIYEATTTVKVGINGLLQSNTWATAPWGLSSASHTAATGDAPIEFFDLFHDSRGEKVEVQPNFNTQVQPNPYEYPATSLNSKDFLSGFGYPVGSYGMIDLLGEQGDFDPVNEILNGSMERADPVTLILDDWSLVETGGTIAGDTGIKYEGAISAKMNRTGAGDLYMHRTGTRMRASQFWRLTVWARSTSATLSGALEVVVENTAETNRYLTSAGTWQAASAVAITKDLTSTFQKFTLDFHVDAGHVSANHAGYRVQIRHASGTVEAIYVDKAWLDGPFKTSARTTYAVPQGWLIVGSSHTWTCDTDRPHYFEIIERNNVTSEIGGLNFQQTGKNGAVVIDKDTILAPLGSGQPAATDYLEAGTTVALPAGWSTITMRLQGKFSTSQFWVQLFDSSGAVYAQSGGVTWGATARWMRVHCGRTAAFNVPDWGLGVLYVHSASARTITVRTTVSGTSTLDMKIDSLRIYGDGGMLYPATDQAETLYENFRSKTNGLLVTLRGVLEQLESGDKQVGSVRAATYTKGLKRKLPSKVLLPECSWKFASPQCGYVSTATATATSSGTGPHTVDDTTFLEAGRKIYSALLKQGDPIPTPIEIATVTSGTQFTTTTAISITNGDLIKYGACRKTFRDCAFREQEFRYGGYRGLTAVIFSGGYDVSQWNRRIYLGNGNWWSLNLGASYYADTFFLSNVVPDAQEGFGRQDIFSQQPLPLIYGRVFSKLIPLEQLLVQQELPAGTVDTWVTSFYAACVGEIEDVRRLIYGGQQLPQITPITISVAAITYQWRAGTRATDAIYTEATWRTDIIGGGSRKIASQTKDFRSSTGTAYSETAHVIVQELASGDVAEQFSGDQDGVDSEMEEAWADVKGRKIQKYNSDGTVSGSLVYSDNPVWCLIDFLLDAEYGVGLPSDIIDWASVVTAATACDVAIPNEDAVTTVASSIVASKIVPLVNVQGFQRGRQLKLAAVDQGEILDVDPVKHGLLLDTAITATAGDVATQTVPTYTLNISFDKQQKPLDVVKAILATMRGRIVYDSGKLGIQIEVALSSEDTYTVEDPLVPGTGQVENITKIAKSGKSGSTFNGALIAYTRTGAVNDSKGLIRITDADSGGLDFLNPLKVPILGCDTPFQALRCGLPIYAKMAPMANDDGNNKAQAQGFKVTTGLEGLSAQRGDRLLVTATESCRVSAIDIMPDLRVVLHGRGERDQIRLEAFGTAIPVHSVTPAKSAELSGGLGEEGQKMVAKTLTIAEVSSVGGKFVYTLVPGGLVAPFTSYAEQAEIKGRYELHVGTSAAFVPDLTRLGEGGTCVKAFSTKRKLLVWMVPESMLNTTLYVKVVERGSGDANFDQVTSNELTVVVDRMGTKDTDPTQMQESSQRNLVFDGQAFESWTANGTPAFTRHDPDGDSAGGETNNFGSRANARDNNAGTDSTGVASNSGTPTPAHVQCESNWDWNAEPTTLRDGVVKFRASKDDALAFFLGRYQVNGGGFVDFGVLPNDTAKNTVSSPQLEGIDLSTFDFQAFFSSSVKFGVANTDNALLEDVWFERDTTVAPFGKVVGGVGYIQGDGTDYGEILHGFPGAVAPVKASRVFKSGQIVTCRIRVKKHTSKGSAADPLDVVIRKIADPTVSETLISVAAADIATTFKAFVARHAMTQDLDGPLEIVVRSKESPAAYSVHQCGVFNGELIYKWEPSPEDASVHIDTSFGIDDAFPTGVWVNDVYKIATVT